MQQFHKLSLTSKFLSLLIPMALIGAIVAVFTWNQINNTDSVVEYTKDNFQKIYPNSPEKLIL